MNEVLLDSETVVHKPTVTTAPTPKEGQAIQVEADVAGGPAGQ